jgi:LysM repeat protein
MRKLALFFVMFGFLQMGLAQNKKNQEVDIVSHTVQMGETVRMLSKKYLVDPSEIYRLNKFAVNGISQGMVLQIPVPKKEPVIQQEEPVAEATPETVEEVHSQEAPPVEEAPTRGVAEQSVAKPKPQKPKAKPVVKEQPVAEQPVTVINRESETEHTVVSGETLYSLSKKYGVSVDEIKMSNDGLKKGLMLGQVVKIPSTRTISGNESSIGSTVTPSTTKADVAPIETADQSTSRTVEAVAPSSDGGAITHKVEPKETLYSLSKKYGVTVDDIKNQNPDVAQKGLQIGQTLTIRKN